MMAKTVKCCSWVNDSIALTATQRTMAETQNPAGRQVRALLIQHHGYEMEGEDGSFVCAFQRSLDALTFSVKLQLELLKVAWSKELLDCPMMEPLYTMAGMPVFGGPRVKVGMCCGNPLRMQISSRTGRMEYFGPFMNHAARVASAAHGGQVRTATIALARNPAPSASRSCFTSAYLCCTHIMNDAIPEGGMIVVQTGKTTCATANSRKHSHG